VHRVFAGASREDRRSKVDGWRALFSKRIGEDFVYKLSTVFRFLHCAAELSAHRERAAPQKSLLFGNWSFHCDRPAAIPAAPSETIPVFIDYQFVARYYEDARAALTGF
jgi:hypothetical protein